MDTGLKHGRQLTSVPTHKCWLDTDLRLRQVFRNQIVTAKFVEQLGQLLSHATHFLKQTASGIALAVGEDVVRKFVSFCVFPNYPNDSSVASTIIPMHLLVGPFCKHETFSILTDSPPFSGSSISSRRARNILYFISECFCYVRLVLIFGLGFGKWRSVSLAAYHLEVCPFGTELFMRPTWYFNRNTSPCIIPSMTVRKVKVKLLWKWKAHAFVEVRVNASWLSSYHDFPCT